MAYKIAGFTDRGEVRIANDDGNVVAYGELRLEDAYSDLDRGDVYGLEVRVNWTRAEYEEALEFEDVWPG